MNTNGTPSYKLIEKLAEIGVNMNVTAIMTHQQVLSVSYALTGAPAIISVFAGRIADTGADYIKIMKQCLGCLLEDNQELLWASPREIHNYYEAEKMKCHIITMTPELIAKLSLKDKNLHWFSLDTVKMFHDDAQSAGLAI
jgi:transaldolase